MKTYFIIIVFLLTSNTFYSQRLNLQQCGAYYLSYVEVAAPYSKKSYHDVGFIQLSYFQKIKPVISIGLRFSYYDPFVSFNIDDYPYSDLISIGKASGTFYNLTFLVSCKYSILNRLRFNTYLGINNSYYRDYYGLVIEGGIGLNSDDPIQGIDKETGYEGFQFRPEVSVGIEWLFLKYFSLEANVAYIQGTRRIQDYEIRYTLMDSEEYYAKNYSNGTMWMPSIGLSFYFGGYNKDELNRKKKKKTISNKKRRKIYK